MRIHLDTDLGGDTDDACALVMLLGWPGVELVGITTTIDHGGRRAGYVAHCLQLAGRTDIPVAAGAEVSLTTCRSADPITGDARYWPAGIAARPSPPGAALDLLDRSIQHGATVVAIGPYQPRAAGDCPARPPRPRPGRGDGGMDGPPALLGQWRILGALREPIAVGAQ